VYYARMDSLIPESVADAVNTENHDLSRNEDGSLLRGTARIADMIDL
jgi:hypothetical protein